MKKRRKRKSGRFKPLDFPIDVLGSGAVLLGSRITCDGFHADRPVRVQTHIHSDHMSEFTTSLRGQIVMTEATRRLLEYEHPALPSRTNVKVLAYGEEYACDGYGIQLLSSDHALGAAQVKVTLTNGITVGYSSDFNWPLRDTIKVDALVVDATYGNPCSRAKCQQGTAQEAFVTLVREKLRLGPIHLMADTGPLERALVALGMADVLEGFPIIGNKRVCWYAEINRAYRRTIPHIICEESAEAQAAMRDGPYVRVWSLNSQLPNDGLYDGVAIRLTKYRTTLEPIEQTGEDVFNVAFSNHADFEGTLKYVEATGASFVVTDNHRGQSNDRAKELAKMLRTHLGVHARVSSNLESRAWGS